MHSASDTLPALPQRARLFTQAECTLCERARVMLERLVDEGLLSVEYVDIEGQEALLRQYAVRVPVLELSTGEVFEGRISEYRLRKLLQVE